MQEETLPDRRATLAVLMMASMTIMANTTIVSSLPGLRDHFADVAGIDTLAGLIVTLPSLAVVLAAGGAGWLADRVNRQGLLVLAATLYAAGGTTGLWADGLTAILAGRLLLGLGVALTMTLAMTWSADLWQGAARARFLGMQGAAISAGGVVFMLLGGTLSSLHWRGAFAVYALVIPVAVLGLIALAPHAREIARNRATADAARSGQRPQAGFPWLAFAFVGTLAFLFMVSFYVTPTRLPFLLEGLGVTSPVAVAAIMAVLTLVSMPMALMYGRIRRYVSAFGVFAFSFAMMGAGLVCHALATGWPMVLLGSVLAGLGMGPSMPNFTTWFMARVPETQRGRAAGLLTTAFFLGQFVSPLISAPLVAGFGLTGAFAVLGLALMVLGAGLAVLALRGRDWQPARAV